MSTILIIEDELELVTILTSYLEKAGFNTISANRGDAGLRLWEQHNPELIILDLNLPGMDGLDVARTIRRSKNTPILILTARVEEIDRVVGLELGADDYVTKPFSPREIVARVRAILRRAGNAAIRPSRMCTGTIEVDLDSHTVLKDKRPIELTPSEFNILAAMMSQPGRVFTRMQLLEVAQGNAYEGYERTIDTHIKNLRTKIEPDSRNPEFIKTIFGVGYRFKEGED